MYCTPIQSLPITSPDPAEMNTDWHQGKDQRNDDRKSCTGSLDQTDIPAVMHSQGSERTLKSVQQVIGQRNASQHVQQHDERILKYIYHSLKKIMIILSLDFFEPCYS